MDLPEGNISVSESAAAEKLAVVLLHDSDEIEHLVRVADFVVIPRNNLHESVGQSDTGLSVEAPR